MKKNSCWNYLVVLPVIFAYATCAFAEPVIYHQAESRALNALESIQAADKELDDLIAEELQNAAADQHMGERQVIRIQRRLERKLPNNIKKMKARVDSISDEQVTEVYERIQSDGLVARSSEISSRSAIKTLLEERMKNSISGTAREIVQAGGMIPFLFKVKASLNGKEGRGRISSSSGACLAAIVGTLLVIGALAVFLSPAFLLLAIIPPGWIPVMSNCRDWDWSWMGHP